MSILYIEDDKIDQILMKRIIRNFNLDLTIVSSFKEAQGLLNNTRFEIILTDNFTIDGELSDWKHIFKNYKIHVVTGDKKYFEEKEILKIESIIEKPISVEKIKNIITDVSCLYSLPYFKESQLEKSEIKHITLILLQDFIEFEEFLFNFNQETECKEMVKRLHDVVPKFKILNMLEAADYSLNLIQSKEDFLIKQLKLDVDKALNLLKKIKL